MNLALFIARRTARSRSGDKPAVTERIAVVSVALGIAAMICTIAVIMGFKREISRKMTGFAAHVTLTDIRGRNTLDARPVRRSEHLEELIRTTPGFVSLAPYALRGGIVRTDDAVEGLALKGVDGTFDRTLFEEWLVDGSFPRVGDTLRTKDLLLSRNMARRLQLQTGDRIEMLFVENDSAPRRDRFKISGIYSSGMDEMDDAVALTDLRNVQRLAEWAPDEISGYEIYTDDLARAGEFAAALDRRLLRDDSELTENLAVDSVQELYPNVFDWLRAHDVNAAVVLVILLAVAVFNMAAALLVLVLERTRTIGLLKALGMRNAPLRNIFLFRASFIALRGLAWGNVIGLALCLLQQQTHLLKLNSEGYLLSEVPVALGWGWLLALNAGFLAAIVLLLTVPASIVSTIKPEETIRYE